MKPSIRLENDFNWNAHVRKLTKSAAKLLRICNALIGKVELNKIMVITKIYSGSQIWRKKAELVTAQNLLTNVQRLALVAIVE